MYKCATCNTRTEDIDSPNCSGHPFRPIQITTIHHARFINGQRVILCTEKPPRPGSVAIGGRFGVSCIRCREKLGVLLTPKEDKGSDLPKGQEPDKILDDLG